MSVVDEINDLENRSLSELKAAYEFRAQTTLAYQTFEKNCTKENAEQRIENPVTGSSITRAELVQVFEGYQKHYLIFLVFQYFISVFESFFFDFLKILLVNEPRHLSQKKKVEVKEIVSSADNQRLLIELAERELNELKYSKVADWFLRLDKIINLGIPEAEEINQLAEIKASRDILTHNAGRVNAIYMTKSGSRARYKIGDQIEITYEYFDESYDLIEELIKNISNRSIKRFTRNK